jgi:hypothetical protein
VAGNGPAFSAYINASSQNPTSATWTKITLTGKEFDTNSNFDNTTNYRFTPTVAGYYQINAEIYFNGAAVLTDVRASIYKNGSVNKQGTLSFGTGSWNNAFITLSNIIYMNGSTDYLELYGYNVSVTSPQFVGLAGYTNFSGALIRAA